MSKHNLDFNIHVSCDESRHDYQLLISHASLTFLSLEVNKTYQIFQINKKCFVFYFLFSPPIARNNVCRGFCLFALKRFSFIESLVSRFIIAEF